MNKMGFLNNKVIKAGSWYTVTEFFLKGIMFLTIPIFTRLLTPSDYGVVSLYETWVGIFTILIGLNLNTSITRAKYEFKNDYEKFIASTMLLSIFVLVSYMIVFMIFGNSLIELTGLSKGIFYFMIIQAYFTFIRTSLIAKLRVEYNYKKISIISIFINIFGVILSIILIKFLFEEQAYIGKIIGNGVLIIISGLVFLIYLLKNGGKELINKKYWKYALLLSLPLMLHSLSGLINAQFDRIIINQYIGDTATGLYSFAYNVGMIINVLTHALDQAWTPWSYEMMEEGKLKAIKERGNTYRNIYTVAYAVLLFISPEIIRVMAGAIYWDALAIIPYIFVGYYFSYMYTLEVKTEFFYKKTHLIAIGTVLSALINITLNLLFVPKYGYVAAAITTSISYFFMFIFHYLITSRIIKVSIYGHKFHLKSIFYMVGITTFYMLFEGILLIRLIGVGTVILLGVNSIKKHA